MPAIKQLLRRTLATTTLNPTPFPLPPPPNHQRMLTPTRYRDRRTLAKGASLSVGVAHVKHPTVIKSVTLYLPPNNHNKNRILCTSNHSSSFSSSSPTEERENNNVKLFSRVSSSSNNSSSGSHQTLVTDMGHERKANNGVNDNNDDEQLPEKGCSKLLTLPTLLTLARVAAIPVFISTFYVKNWWGTTATTSIFIIAAITDWLDGYLARKMSLGTAFGAFLDPVADKLMVAATLVLLCSRPPETAIFGDLPWLFPVPAIAIIGREITMSAVREWAASQNTKLLQAVSVNNLGKWKTATQMAALTILLVTRDTSLSDPGPLVATGVVLLYISAGLAVWSLFVYMRNIWKVLLK